jgi:hypothetical protein
MTVPAQADKTPTVGFVVSGRSNPRLLRATLRSIELMTERPDLVLVVVPKGREHAFDRAQWADSPVRVRSLMSEGADDSWLGTGLRTVAPAVDIAIFAAEGTIFDGEYLSDVKRRYATWEDFVGSIELVSSVIKVDADTVDEDLAVAMQRREGRLHSLLRRRLRACSLIPSVLAVRTEACNKLKFVSFSAFCDWMSYALLLDQLRRRGRTTVEFGKHLAEMRFDAERRSGFDFGYTIYDRISRIEDYTSPGALRASYLAPRLEKLKLFGEQALQYFLSPSRKKHIVTIIQGMLAARRDLKTSMRNVQRDIRAMS